MIPLLRLVQSCCLTALLGGAIHTSSAARAIVVSVAEQKLAVIDGGSLVAEFPVSTSKFGMGDRTGSYATPLGTLEVASKIGANAPLGAVFKSRVRTGEVLRPNTPGRDPIVTRILWLRGLESGNAKAYQRGIYIHGTPDERSIGRKASYGCIRMRSRDVVRLFDSVPVGTRIEVTKGSVRAGIAAVTAPRTHQGNRLAINSVSQLPRL
jgi:lipoprotein-anchoring transpeptidase ErfK/SrfK